MIVVYGALVMVKMRPIGWDNKDKMTDSTITNLNATEEPMRYSKRRMANGKESDQLGSLHFNRVTKNTNLRQEVT